jgi:hypothetical protein
MRVAEALVALTLGGVVVATAWGVALRQAAAVEGLAQTSRQVEAVATAALILDWELTGSELPTPRGRELELRAWRGWGRACDAGPDGAVVAWRGLRRPDPRRDSLLVATDAGATAVVPLSRSRRARPGRGEGPCVDADVVEVGWPGGALRVDGTVVWVRAFESGVYRVDDALRYRRGRGGAQPLTEARFDPEASAWHATGSGLRLRVVAPPLVGELAW